MKRLLLLILLSIGFTNVSFAEIKIPTFGHASSAEGGWTCNENYYRSMNKKTCFKVPKNSTSNSLSNYFKCNTGYKKSGDKCIKKINKLVVPSYRN